MKTKYICKCGKIVYKSTNADTTGNRDTAGCEGCPYLLPWGPMVFSTREDGTQGYHMEIRGYECRMSPTIDYATTYYGRPNDKTTLRIVSLDLAFLEQVQVWINEHAEGQLFGGFSRDTIRGTDYSQAGRYCWSISCSQNKKGMAAKAALIQHFFDSGHRRLDMTPEEEKAHILAAIEAGKAAYQRKKENMEYIISENLENDCVYAYAANEFWVYDKQACRWYTSGFCREQYERAKQKLSRLTPEDFLTDSSDYNLLDDYQVTTQALNALQRAVAGKREIAPFEGTNPTTPADVDASPCAPGVSDAPPLPSQSAAADAQQGENDNLPEVCRGCQCATCGNEDCPTPCRQKSDEVEECEQLGPMGDDCEDYQPKEDAECLKTPAPNGDAAASTDENAAQQPQQGETPITPTNASSSSDPACPADAGAATQSLSAADAVSLAAEEAPAFDYSEFDAQTVADLHLAEREYAGGKKMAEMGLRRMAEAVAIAHDALCGELSQIGTTQKHGNRGEDTFRRWCESMRISKSAAYRFLNVSGLFDRNTPTEQKVLEEATSSVLYEASRPSAEPEAVEALKRQQVKTLKEYRELEAQIKAEREAREKAEHDAQRYREDSEKARAAAHTYHCQYEQVNDQRNALLDQQGEYAARIVDAEQRAKEAEERARAAQSGQAQQLANAKKQWQAAAAREKQAAVDAAIEQAHTDARASAAVDVLFDQLENTVAALQAALETLEGTDADKAAKLRRSLARLLQTLAAQMGVADGRTLKNRKTDV